MDISRFSAKRIRRIYVYISTIFIAVSSFFLLLAAFFRLLNASSNSIFIALVYGIADIFRWPFFQAFPGLINLSNSTLDTVGLLAFFTYLAFYFLGLIVVFLISTIFFEVEKTHPHIPMYYIHRVWTLSQFKTWAGIRDSIEQTRKEGFEKDLPDKMLKKVINLEDLGHPFPQAPEELSQIINQGESEEETGVL